MKSLTSIRLTALLFCFSSATAWGAMPSFGGLKESLNAVAGDSSEPASTSDVVPEDSSDNSAAISAEEGQEAIVTEFKQILSGVALAQVKVLNAYGLKDQAAALEADANLISGECDKKCLDKAVAGSMAANEEIEKLNVESAQLDAEGKAILAEAIPPLLINSYGFVKFLPKVSEWGKSAGDEMKAAGFMGAAKLKKKFDIGLFIVSKTPSVVKDISSTAKMLMTYSKENNIEIEGADDFEF
jgi:hypothetical protein